MNKLMSFALLSAFIFASLAQGAETPAKTAEQIAEENAWIEARESTGALLKEGQILRSQGMFVEAIAKFDEALKLKQVETVVGLLFSRAEAMSCKANNKDGFLAAMDWLKAEGEKRGVKGLLCEFCGHYATWGMPDEAQRILDASLAQVTDTPSKRCLWSKKALLYMQAGDAKAAYNLFVKILMTDPGENINQAQALTWFNLIQKNRHAAGVSREDYHALCSDLLAIYPRPEDKKTDWVEFIEAVSYRKESLE